MAQSVQVNVRFQGARQTLCMSDKEQPFQHLNSNHIHSLNCTTSIKGSYPNRLSSSSSLATLNARTLHRPSVGFSDKVETSSSWSSDDSRSRKFATDRCKGGKRLQVVSGTGLNHGALASQDAGVSTSQRDAPNDAALHEEKDVAEKVTSSDGTAVCESRSLKVQLRKKTRKSVAEIRAAALGDTDTAISDKPAKLKKKKKKSVKDEGTKKKKGKKKATERKANEVEVVDTESLTGGSNEETAESQSLEEEFTENLLDTGQKLLELKEFKDAERCFSECVRRCDEESAHSDGGKLVDALLGLSEALCGQSSYDAASAAASKAADLDPSNPKALYQSGVAFLHLECFFVARGCFADCKALLEDHCDPQEPVYAARLTALKAIVDQALKDTDRCERQSRGEFDLESFHTNHYVPHPVADYIGPVVISEVGGKGRGLTVTRDVKQGELLLVTKAVAVSSREGRPPGREVDTTAQDAQVAKAVYERVCVDPWVRAQVECMYDGTDRKLSVPSIDLFLMSSYPTTHRRALLTPDGGLLAGAPERVGPVSSDLDLERIERVKKYNAFSTEAAPSISGEEAPSEMDEVGLWTLAGIINHSCLPTASYFVIGDVHFVFAVQDLPRGTEVTQPYMAIAEPVRKRQRDTRLLYKFSCRCPRCEYEETHVDELQPAMDAWQEIRDSGAELLRRAEDEGGAAAEEAFRFFRARLDVVEATIGKVGRTEMERNWLRAAYMTAYTRFERACEFVGDWDACEAAGLACLDAMESVNLYYSFTIQHAAEISELLLCKYGKDSEEWRRHKQRVLRIVERSLNCVPKYASEAIEDVEALSKRECRELFSKELCRW